MCCQTTNAKKWNNTLAFVQETENHITAANHHKMLPAHTASCRQEISNVTQNA